MIAAASPLRCFHPSNLLTYASLLASIAAIACAGLALPGVAGALIALAVILDTFDGRFARMFARSGDQRAIGGQLDSLADAVSFGLAPAMCMVMQMPPDRRLVFGPTLQMVQNPETIKGEHDFCPCCLFTNSIDAFDVLLKDKAFYGIRLFASLDAEGHIEADCRVNGVDRPEGAAALIRYAQTWPDRGFEYRKQYVCIQTREPAK